MNKLLALAEGAMVVSHQQHLLAELGYSKRESQIDLKKDHLHALSYLGLPYQDHNYGAPPPPTPPQSPPRITSVEPIVTVVDSPHQDYPLDTPFDDDPPLEESRKEGSNTTDDDRDEEGEDEEEANQYEGITRCICDFEHDDGYMICCDRCLVWQHVECMGLDRSNIPDNYFCEKCEPRLVDVATAKILQGKKKKHLEALQRREEQDDESDDSPRAKKKVKKKKKRKERDKEKDKRKKKRERGDSTISNGSDDNHRSEGNESDTPQLDDSTSSTEASLIQCTPELETLMNEYRKNPEMFLAGTATYHGSPEEMRRTKVCIGQVSKGEVNGVVTLEQIPANEPIMQLSGTLSLLDEKRKNSQLESFMFMYSSFCNTELVLNAGSHDNKARFTRKSCSPNAEIRHMIVDGEVQLYTFALKDISSDQEVTLGIDYDFTLGPHPVKCACGKKSCPVKKFWHKHKSNGIKQKNNNNAGETKPSSPVKKTVSPLRLNLNKQTSQETPKRDAETQPTESSKSEPVTPRVRATSSTEETPETKPLHKMTREERKMDAILKAFERMEKTQQRRQQTLERLAKEKPAIPEATTPTETTVAEMDETQDETPDQQEQGSPDQQEQGTPDQQEQAVKATEPEEEPLIEEQKTGEVKAEKSDEIEEEKVEPEETTTEQEKAQIPQVNTKPKPRVQRKRRRTGTSRRRSRNSSGASSTVSIEVSVADDEPAPVSESPCPSTAPEVTVIEPIIKPIITTTAPTYASTVTSPPISSLLSVQTSILPENKDTTPLASPAANSKHFKFPKTKRFFMNEWLNEKAQEASADSPLTVKTDVCEITTISSPNAAATRDRSTSLDGSLGSAKKRWLRQAMQENSQPGGNESNSPVCNGGGSPVTPSPAVSPNSNSSDFMTPLKKRLLRHSLSEERPSQRVERPSIEDSSSVDQSLITIKEEKNAEHSEESPAKISSFHLQLPAKKETRENSSVDSGLSVTTPADLEPSPSFPTISSSSSPGQEAPKKELTPIESEDESKSIKVTEQLVKEASPLVSPVINVDSAMGSETTVPTLGPGPTLDAVKAPNPLPSSSPGLVLGPGPTAGATPTPGPASTVDCAQTTATTPSAALTGSVVSRSLKRCLSDEVSFMNGGGINPAYYSPKKRHLYLRQNIEPGSNASLGASWPRQDPNKLAGPIVSEGALSHSWSGSSGIDGSHPPGLRSMSPSQPPAVASSSAGVRPASNAGFASPVQGDMMPPGIPVPAPPGFESRVLPPAHPPDMMTSPNYPGHVERGPPAEECFMSPKAAASVSAPTTPSKKRVSLLEYRKRKSFSATKKPPAEPDATTAEETKEIESPGEAKVDASPTSTTADSTPEKTTAAKPANIITFKDKKFPSVPVVSTASNESTGGLQNLPLFSTRAPIAESDEGKKLTLTDEAHQLITSLTQVLMEGKSPEKPKANRTAADVPQEDPLQRMRRELNEKNKEKVMALKRAHSPEPPPPPPEKKLRPDPVNSPPVPPPPPPRQAPPYAQAMHSPKGGGLVMPGNHVVVNPVVVNPTGYPVVPQVVPQTNGGHMVYPPVIAGNPPGAQFPQQPITTNHSPRGSQQSTAAKLSPRGLPQPVPGKHSPRAHYSPGAATYTNHVEEHVTREQGPPYQNYHVNGGPGRKVSPTSYSNSKYPTSSVHDKRSSSYGRNNLSPRRYQRH